MTRAPLIGGPLDGEAFQGTVLPTEIRYPAELLPIAKLEHVAVNECVAVDVSERRYIKQLFVVHGRTVYAYVWEHTTPAEALRKLLELEASI